MVYGLEIVPPKLLAKEVVLIRRAHFPRPRIEVTHFFILAGQCAFGDVEYPVKVQSLCFGCPFPYAYVQPALARTEMLETPAQRLPETFFVVQLVIDRESYEKIELLLVDLPPQPRFAADHIPVFPLDILLYKLRTKIIAFEVGRHLIAGFISALRAPLCKGTNIAVLQTADTYCLSNAR